MLKLTKGVFFSTIQRFKLNLLNLMTMNYMSNHEGELAIHCGWLS